jgi:7-keto-8-aminopelargonate synthetase-like enzyme
MSALPGSSNGCARASRTLCSNPQLLAIRFDAAFSRPCLFSNTIPSIVVKASTAVMDMISATTELRDEVKANAKRFHKGMTEAGFDIKPGDRPIVPIMVYNPNLGRHMMRDLCAEGICMIGDEITCAEIAA